MANVLSLLRLAAALPFAWLLGQHSAASALLFALAIVTDLVDGALARRRGGESALGRALDHGADFAFVSAGLWTAAARGAVPWLLPAAIALAFAQYVLDSLFAHRARALRMNRLGRWNGVLYFVPLGGVCLTDLGFPGLEPATRAVAAILVATTGLSIADRILALRPARTAPAARAAGTADRWPR